MTTEEFIVLIMEHVEDEDTRKDMYEAVLDKLSASSVEKLHHLIGDDDILDNLLEKEKEDPDDYWSEDSDF